MLTFPPFVTIRNELEDKTEKLRKSEEEMKKLRLNVEKNLNEELNVRLKSFQQNLERIKILLP